MSIMCFFLDPRWILIIIILPLSHVLIEIADSHRQIAVFGLA